MKRCMLVALEHEPRTPPPAPSGPQGNHLGTVRAGYQRILSTKADPWADEPLRACCGALLSRLERLDTALIPEESENGCAAVIAERATCLPKGLQATVWFNYRACPLPSGGPAGASTTWCQPSAPCRCTSSARSSSWAVAIGRAAQPRRLPPSSSSQTSS